MKKLVLFTLIALTVSTGVTLAQFTGRRFISGDASVSFGNSNPDASKATNGYGYGINIGLGKFKTETLATGWNLSTSLSGRRENITVDNEEKSFDGIWGAGVGVGRFWHFYKHFNENFGIYGGPDIGIGYLFTRTTIYNESEPFNARTHAVSLSFGINAGAYYKLSERWWALGSLGFSQPIALQYAVGSSKSLLDGEEYLTKNFTYGFAPAITFPSVSLGLRYFFRD